MSFMDKAKDIVDKIEDKIPESIKDKIPEKVKNKLGIDDDAGDGIDDAGDATDVPGDAAPLAAAETALRSSDPSSIDLPDSTDEGPAGSPGAGRGSVSDMDDSGAP